MIVFPMAGLSRRFSEAGYDQPKYMLPLEGGPCFDAGMRGQTRRHEPEHRPGGLGWL